jgi:hypothetical protein
MMQLIDSVRFKAFAQLLDEPDPLDLPRRGHVLRCEGDPHRRVTRLPGILMAWLQRRHLELDGDQALSAPISMGKRHRRPPHSSLRVLRPIRTGDRRVSPTPLSRSSPIARLETITGALPAERRKLKAVLGR